MTSDLKISCSSQNGVVSTPFSCWTTRLESFRLHSPRHLRQSHLHSSTSISIVLWTSVGNENNTVFIILACRSLSICCILRVACCWTSSKCWKCLRGISFHWHPSLPSPVGRRNKSCQLDQFRPGFPQHWRVPDWGSQGFSHGVLVKVVPRSCPGYSQISPGAVQSCSSSGLYDTTWVAGVVDAVVWCSAMSGVCLSVGVSSSTGGGPPLDLSSKGVTLHCPKWNLATWIRA